MKYRTLGRTGVKVSLLGLGTGGRSRLGQPVGMSQGEQTALVRRCLDLGINYFDTSQHYGESEAILGRAFEGVPRESYVIASKWLRFEVDSVVIEDARTLARSVERSLRRLGTEYIDVMQFHALLPQHYREVVERFYPEMKRLQQQGKVRFIGFSERFPSDPGHEAVTLALKSEPEIWDVVMLKYGILNQVAAAEALPLARKHGVGIINMAVVREKLPDPDRLQALIAEWKHGGQIPADGLPAADPLGWLVHDEVASIVSAGYKFAADHPAVSAVLTGTASLEHLESNVAAIERPFLPEADTRRLVELLGRVAEYA